MSAAGASWRGWAIFGLLLLVAVVLPFLAWGDAMEGWVGAHDWAGTAPAAAGLLGVVLLAADVVLPVPSSVVATLLGQVLGIWVGTLTGTLGLTLGCVLGLALGRAAAPATLGRLVPPDQARRAAAWIERHGTMALVLCRPVPVLAEASVIVAGTLRMPLARALAALLPANLGISFAYAGLGGLAAGGLQFLLAFLLCLAAGGLAMLLARRHERRAPSAG